MKGIHIKCNNIKEEDFIEKYLLNSGYIWNDDLLDWCDDNDFKYPILIYNISYSITILKSNYDEFWTDLKIIETKILMRKEKLKRIQ